MAKPTFKKAIYQGRLLNVTLEDRTLPNGRRVSLEYVRHPGSVAIVPFLDERHILLIRQYRPVINRYIWEIPAGTLARGERPINCARRELLEETGFSARRLVRLCSFFTTPGFTTERMYLYAAYGLMRQARHTEADEIIKLKAFSLKQIKAMVRSHKIDDAKSLVGLFSALACYG